jgi:hypothetical protein
VCNEGAFYGRFGPSVALAGQRGEDAELENPGAATGITQNGGIITPPLEEAKETRVLHEFFGPAIEKAPIIFFAWRVVGVVFHINLLRRRLPSWCGVTGE